MTLRRRTFLVTSALLAGAAAIAVTILPRSLFAQTVPAVYAEDGIAIRGTDPVAYFTEGSPVAGDPAIHADWNGARWLFASTANRDRFLADPAAHAPQFGGYCSWAVAQGYTAPIDPAAWAIVGGKLYLNYSPAVQRDWQEDVPGNIAKATTNWPGLHQ